MLAEAAARGGASAVMKALPSVFRHIVTTKPKAAERPTG